MNKSLKLTMNPKLHAALVQKADQRAMTAQEYIYELIRNKVFAKNNAGRPEKKEFIDMFSRKR
ncbi:hypothetical protein HY489_02045 [Candidatus Woesearchaeota archaeon]|nr:hypothetical protein [Candidatus Woesearchaeota archaeon]